MARKAKTESEPQLAAFEPELKKLQEAVAKLESTELSLEESFQQWEKGCSSYVTCRKILQSAKTRIETLAKNFSSDDLEWELFKSEDADEE